MTEPAGFSGSGPGPQTQDGCSVALYAQLPYLDELDDCGLALGRGSQVLELAEVGASGKSGAVTVHVEAVDRAAPCIAMTLRYALEGDVWRQSFRIVSLSEAEIESLLAAGFASFEWRGRKRRWLRAIAAPLGGPLR